MRVGHRPERGPRCLKFKNSEVEGGERRERLKEQLIYLFVHYIPEGSLGAYGNERT